MLARWGGFHRRGSSEREEHGLGKGVETGLSSGFTAFGIDCGVHFFAAFAFLPPLMVSSSAMRGGFSGRRLKGHGFSF